MKISFEGLDSIGKDLKKDLSQVVAKLADEVLVDARKNTPIKTGRARRGWKKQITENNFAVENRVPYIERLEAGASKQAPKGIIGPTLSQIKGKI